MISKNSIPFVPGNPWSRDSSPTPKGPGASARCVGQSKENTSLPLNRRHFIRTGGAVLAAAALTTRLQAGYTKLKIGAPDWNLRREAKPASIELAKTIGFDVGNSFNNGFDIYKEIGWLGKERICEFHLKDNPHLLGRGKIDFPKVIDAIVETGFSGWTQLETEA